MKSVKHLLLVIPMLILIASCDLRKPESAEEKNNLDSLFMGIHFGMERKEFYEHCWEYNRKKIFSHGPTNQSVEYSIVNELPNPVIMRFYPSFYQDKIFEMPVVFAYEAWAPWNRQFSSDSLLVKMVPVLERWYETDFKVADHKTMGKVYYKIDGKRRINVFKRDDQFIQVVFTDMEVKTRKKKAEDLAKKSEQTNEQ